MRRLIDFYRLQIQVMRDWRPSTGSRLRRLISTLVVSVIAFGFAVWLTPGVDLKSGAGAFTTALLAAIVLGLLNILVRPAFIAIFATVSVIAVVIATLVFQVLSFLVLPAFVGGLDVSGIVPALIASFVYAIVTTVIVAIFSISSDDSYYSILVQQLSARQKGVIRTDRSPGCVIVQIDGLAHPMLHPPDPGRPRAVISRLGHARPDAPRGSWTALLPSRPRPPARPASCTATTTASRPSAGTRRRHGRMIVSNHPEDAVESRGAGSRNGEGLLSNNGASIGNLFSGDAARSYITMGTIKTRAQGLGKSQTFLLVLRQPVQLPRARSSLRQAEVGQGVRPGATARDGPGSSPGCIAAAAVPDRRAPPPTSSSAICPPSLVIEEMYARHARHLRRLHRLRRDRPPQRARARRERSMRSTASTRRSARLARRPPRTRRGRTEFVVLSDHGQTLGATFLQRYGKTLGDVVRGLMGTGATVEESAARVEEWGPTNAFLSELTQAKGVSGGIARSALRSQTTDGVVELGPAGADEAEGQARRDCRAGQTTRPDCHRVGQPRPDLLPTAARASHARNAGRDLPRARRQARCASGGRRAADPIRGPRRARGRSLGDQLPRREPHRGRRSRRPVRRSVA